MIQFNSSKVWTDKGWLSPMDLSVGDTVISYNADRGCTEYDKILKVQLDYTVRKELFAIQGKNVVLFVTPDHPLMIDKNGLNYIPARDHLLKSGTMIVARPFETYKETANIEDVRWCGRYAALFNKVQHIPHINLVKSITSNLSGYEAQAWLEEFYRWNVLVFGVNWMKSSLTKNKTTRDLVLEIAARAGVGAVWWATKRLKYRVLRITTTGDLPLSYSNYGSKEYQGLLFDVKTKNGNYLMQRRQGSFLVASSLS